MIGTETRMHSIIDTEGTEFGGEFEEGPTTPRCCCAVVALIRSARELAAYAYGRRGYDA